MNAKEKAARDKYYANECILPPECDALCRWRPCYHKYENKGAYSVGRGYTNYYDIFIPVCGHRMCHGCPEWRNKPGDKIRASTAIQWAYDTLGDSSKSKLKNTALEVLQRVAKYLESKEVEK